MAREHRELQNRYVERRARCEELELRSSEGSKVEDEAEDEEESLEWRPGSCLLCRGDAAGSSDRVLCADGCGALAHAACIKAEVNNGPNSHYVALRGGWHETDKGYVRLSCW